MRPEQLANFFNEWLLYKDGTLYRKKAYKGSAVAGDSVGCLEHKGYLSFRLNYKTYKIHRVVWIMFNGDIPTNMQIDHIDGDRKNNRIENLRLATSCENQQNRQINANSSTKIKGLSWHKRDKLWIARIQVRFTRVEKRFEDKELAIAWLISHRAFFHAQYANNGEHKCNRKT